MRVEVLIVAIWIASVAAIVLGALGVMREWAKAGVPPQAPHQARHRAPCTPLLTRLADAYLSGAREMATASALLKGVPL